jgi:hypothetical protein
MQFTSPPTCDDQAYADVAYTAQAETSDLTWIDDHSEPLTEAQIAGLSLVLILAAAGAVIAVVCGLLIRVHPDA